MLISILIILTILNGIQNEAILDISHPYEVLNFDKSILTELKLHRQRRSVKGDKKFEDEIEKRWKRDLEKEEFNLLDDYDRHSTKSNHLMYGKLPENEFDLQDSKLNGDDDLFKKRKLRNEFKHKVLNEKLENRHFKLNFNAHNRQFKLLLKGKHHNDVFASDVEFESTKKGKFNYDTDNIINGYLEDENGSYIEGVITHDGLIDGLIRTNDEEFYIEPARTYLRHDKLKSDKNYRNHTNDFHSIIYKLSDITFPNITCKHHYYDHKDVSTDKHHLNKRQTDEFKNSSSIKPLPYLNSSSISEPDQLNNKFIEAVRKKDSVSTKKPAKSINSNRKYYWNKPYWKEIDALHYNSEAYGVRAIQRTHWTSDIDLQNHLVVDSKKTTCMLYLQADHLFYNRMGSEEACVETMVRHVQKVNSIYRLTDFDQDGRPDNISFLIKRIKVHTTEALKDNEYRFPANYGVERFLEIFSEEDYDAFCLSYIFTFRDFDGGTLGLAWTGDLKNAGGVCEKNGHYRGSLKSLNTGIVTLLNDGKHVPPIVSHVTLAHEIGHNFGSAHDAEDDINCTPGGENGNYIMFARATSGDKKNNNKFSPCSLKSINAVLNTKARSLKGCFQEPQEAICGNEVLEGNEECDCGWEEDCTEPCCFPMTSNPKSNEKPCTLRPGFVCSPSQGPCCTHDTCRLKVGNKCRDDNGCRTASYCSGQNPSCPLSINKPNKTICNEESVCFMGECTGSICIAYGLESCQCKKKEGVDNKRGDPYCELCCRLPGDDSSCKSSFEWNSPPYDVPDLLAKPGTPCMDYRGYCDASQICREVSPTGLGFIRYLLSDQSISLIRNWVQHQWICAAVLCCIAFVLCALLLRALRKAHQNETCKKASNLLAVPGILGNNPISSGFTLFGHTPTSIPPNPMTSNQAGLQTNETSNAAFTTNPYNSTYAVTGNTNYSNAYGYAPINSVQQQKSSQQANTYADYGITNSALLPATTTSDQTNPATNLIDSIYGSSGLSKVNQTTAYLNNQNNSAYTTTNSSMNQPENDLSTNYNAPAASMNLNNLNNQTQFNLNSNLSNNLSSNLSSNLSRPPAYNQFQSNYTSYNSNNLINRQNRLSNIKNLSSTINSTSTASSSFSGSNNKSNSGNLSSNSSSSRSIALNKSYGKSNSNLNNLNNLSYNSNNQQSFNSNQMQSNYQPYQTQYFQQQSHSHRSATNNSTQSASEYGHTPLSLNQWV